MGGKALNRNKYADVLNDLFEKFLEVCINEGIDFPLIHMKKSINVRNIGDSYRNNGVASYQEWLKTNKGSIRDYLKDPNRPVIIENMPRVRLLWLKGRYNHNNRFAFVKSKLFYLKASKKARQMIYNNIINGKVYYNSHVEK